MLILNEIEYHNGHEWVNYRTLLDLLRDTNQRPHSVAQMRRMLRDGLMYNPLPVKPVVQLLFAGLMRGTWDKFDEPFICPLCDRRENVNWVAHVSPIQLVCGECFVFAVRFVCLNCERPATNDERRNFCNQCSVGKICLSCHAELTNIKAGLCDACAIQGQLVPYGADVPQVLKAAKIPPHSHRPLLLGIELEIAPATSAARLALRDAVDEFAVLKADRSIMPDNGVEIVTIPLTLEEQFLRWKPVFNGPLQDCRATPRCGLHVHIDTPGEGKAITVGKIMHFIHRPMNEGLINKIAGRKVNEIRGDDGQRMCYQRPGLNLSATMMRNWRGDHHSALNVGSRNRNATMELRIFASTNQWDVFMARLEFSAALGLFARQVSLTELNDSDFLRWLKSAPFPFLQFALGLRRTMPTIIPALAKQAKRQKVLQGNKNVAEVSPFLLKREVKTKKRQARSFADLIAADPVPRRGVINDYTFEVPIAMPATLRRGVVRPAAQHAFIIDGPFPVPDVPDFDDDVEDEEEDF